MDTSPPAPAVRLLDGVRHTAATLLGHLGVPRFRAFVTENAATLNDTLPVHSKWWRDRAAEGGDLLYVAIGDSTAQGIGASGPGLSYVGLLAERAAERTGRVVHAMNLSVSGATTALAVRDQLPKLARLRAEPDLVTVSIGANDIALWNPAEFDRNIRTIFAALPAHAIVADVPCFYLPRNERKVAEANRMLRAAAREYGLQVVPLHEHTRRQGLRGILTEFARDMFHPNDAGYRVWAGAFRPAVDARLARVLASLARRAHADAAPSDRYASAA
ncbi:SGNH/GDSL hydrolase family protein [Agromyces silvae]|uniref:SGNH/GDSL hydrolase family protein n=1 Tax=Agromyces silvae TaxID=3388266 RepID=UPI00280AF18E|nr:SGNH/GDSL hydrolase family protein [Agromyces protaetiae]